MLHLQQSLGLNWLHKLTEFQTKEKLTKENKFQVLELLPTVKRRAGHLLLRSILHRHFHHFY
jgi:hypothetical protein